jgi:GNAT superfamily N-acetyltransferase
LGGASRPSEAVRSLRPSCGPGSLVAEGAQDEEGLTRLPDWRIACFFVDRDHRHKGVAAAALTGALRQIARLGGGTVESYPQDVEGSTTSGSFLYNATLSMFEKQGFRQVRRLGKNHWVVRKAVRKPPSKARRRRLPARS